VIFKLTSFWHRCWGVGVFQYWGLLELLRLGPLKNPKKFKILKILKKRIKMTIFH